MVEDALGECARNTLSGYERTIRKYIIGAIGDMYMDEVTTDDLRLLLVPISKQSASLYSKMNMLIKCVSIQQKKAKSSVIIRLRRFLQKAEHQSRKRRH